MTTLHDVFRDEEHLFFVEEAATRVPRHWVWQLVPDGIPAFAIGEPPSLRLSGAQNVANPSRLVGALAKQLPVGNLFEGFVVSFGRDGRAVTRSNLARLLAARRVTRTRTDPSSYDTIATSFFAFDLLVHEGRDIRHLCLLDRLARLSLSASHTGDVFVIAPTCRTETECRSRILEFGAGRTKVLARDPGAPHGALRSGLSARSLADDLGPGWQNQGWND